MSAVTMNEGVLSSIPTGATIAGRTAMPDLTRPEIRTRQVVSDFFEQLQTAGLLYPHFRLGYDEAGNVIDPTFTRRTDWNRVDEYKWAVFAAMTEEIVCPESVIKMIPSYGNLHGFTQFDTSHVQWFLNGWLHQIYNYRAGRKDRQYCWHP
ncbi:unnamed protein product, partial [Symbiodinium microadriaticum]